MRRMQRSPENLSGALAEGLAPLYLVAGDEPLQLGEACDAVRAACREAGFDERTVLGEGADFDYAELAASADNLSLFATRRLLELRWSGKPGKEGGKVLQAYAAQPPRDTVLLISGPRIERRSRDSAWYRALDKAGVVVNVWPIERERFPPWLARRARGLDLDLDAEAARLLAERVENNMLAAAQELEKLRLLLGPGAVDADTVLRAVADSARFNVFDLADAILAGDAPRVCRVLQGLREEGVEPVLVLWAIAREVRTLASVSAALRRGVARDTALREAQVWSQRKALVGRALQRQCDWAGLLRQAAAADRVVKGAAAGPWRALQRLALAACGKPLGLAEAS